MLSTALGLHVRGLLHRSLWINQRSFPVTDSIEMLQLTDERKCTGSHTNAESNAIIRPDSCISGGSEYEVLRVLRPKVNQRDQDREKADNVPDESDGALANRTAPTKPGQTHRKPSNLGRNLTKKVLMTTPSKVMSQYIIEPCHRWKT